MCVYVCVYVNYSSYCDASPILVSTLFKKDAAVDYFNKKSTVFYQFASTISFLHEVHILPVATKYKLCYTIEFFR